MPRRKTPNGWRAPWFTERLAACVNVVPQVRSFYRWKGELETGDEFLLIIKTLARSVRRTEHRTGKAAPLRSAGGAGAAHRGRGGELPELAGPEPARRCRRMIALIFDMDGVIVDSNPMHREAWEVFNRRYGLETTQEMHERMYGKRNDEIVRDFFGDTLSEEEVAARGYAKEALYREMVAGRMRGDAGAGTARIPGPASGSSDGGGQQRGTGERYLFPGRHRPAAVFPGGGGRPSGGAPQAPSRTSTCGLQNY